MTHQEYAEGLRLIASWVEEHPEIPLPSNSIENYAVDSKEEAAAMVRAFGTCRKEYSDYSLRIVKNFGALTYAGVFTRNQVCRRVVIGVETVPAKYVEAHTEPARTVDVVKWECDPILEPSEAPHA